MFERRKMIRFKAGFDVIYRVCGYLNQGNHAKVLEISKGGLSFRCKTPVTKGDLVELTFKIPVAKEPIVAFAEVSWVRQTGDFAYDVGMKFTKIGFYEKEKLIDYVYRQLKP